MRRGTTQTFRLIFALSVPIASIQRWCVSFAFNSAKKVFLEIDSKDQPDRFSAEYDPDGNAVLSFRLTEEESLEFKDGLNMLQIKMLTADGDVVASNIYIFNVEPIISTTVFSK